MYYCSVWGCKARSDRDTELSFFSIPAVNSRYNNEFNSLLLKRREAWFKSVCFKRAKKGITDIDTLDRCKICSKHFVHGKPADFRAVNNVDWVPSIHVSVREFSSNDNLSIVVGKRTPQSTNRGVVIQSGLKKRKLFHVIEEGENNEENVINVSCEENNDESLHCSQPAQRECGTQTELSWKDISKLETNAVIQGMDKQLFEKYDSSSKKLTYYTGLPNLSLFVHILSVIDNFLSGFRIKKLSNFQKLLIVFMKLRLNLDFTDLSYRFDVRRTTISKLFKHVIICLDHCFGELIYWPDRESLQAVMPHKFIAHFGDKVRVIIDCFEIATQRPSLLNAKAYTFSNYKGRNTIQYLIGITPVGSVSFISQGYGGRISDKVITEKSAFLDRLAKEDIVLADRGFTIEDEVKAKGAKLIIPDFRKRNVKQLTPYEVENTRAIATVRIHVERVIGSLRQKYKITNGPIPMSMLQDNFKGVALIDYVVRVACILVNLCDSIVDSV